MGVHPIETINLKPALNEVKGSKIKFVRADAAATVPESFLIISSV